MSFSLPPFDPDTGDLNTIIETPKGSRNKFAFREDMGLFVLKGVLPLGAVFPFDFGYVPSTVGEDGDALDVLVLMDEPAFVGCLVPARLLGVIEAEQRERNGEIVRNDRVIGVASHSRHHAGIKSIHDLDRTLLDEIEHFFVSYNVIKGKEFRPLARRGPEQAKHAVEKAHRARQHSSQPG